MNTVANMKNQFSCSPVVPQRPGKAVAAALLLALCAILQGCATSGPNLAAGNDSEPQALITVQSKDQGAQSQSPSFLRLVSFKF